MITDCKPDSKAGEWYQKGDELRCAGDYAQAIIAFNTAIDCSAVFAAAYFKRGVCHYLLGHLLQATDDLHAAALLGCEDAQLWSKYDTKVVEDIAEEGDP
jgi:tetratricopeptide (TPR) repeat protein